MHRMPTLRRIVLLAILTLPVPAKADLVVIVNHGRALETLSKEDVVSIFMGRYRKLSDGEPVWPLDIDAASPQRQAFYKNLLDKSLAEINAYWARLVFSGRTSPPLVLENEAAVLERVANDPGAIGYVDSARLDQRVKTVFRLTD